MVKRGIGAVVLAIIAALLLGYLLKDKSRERQDVVEMSLPGTADNKIPSLSATADNATKAVADGANQLAENTSNASGAVVATAAGAAVATATNAAENVKQNVNNVATNNPATNTVTKTRMPGFNIRPAAPNEKRDRVADTGTNMQENAQTASNNIKRVANTDTPNARNTDNVVASANSAPKQTYRPRLIKERKTRVVSSTLNSAKTKPTKHITKPAKTVSKAVTSTQHASKGGYAIQLMATSSQSRAKKLANTMKKEGYVSYITQTNRNNKVLFRVRIAVKGNRNTAISAQQKMKRRYKKNFFVQNSLVVSN